VRSAPRLPPRGGSTHASRRARVLARGPPARKDGDDGRRAFRAKTPTPEEDERDGAAADDAHSTASSPPDIKQRMRRFETSRAVLTRVEDSMLPRMLGRCDAMLQLVDGCISIDHDGECFGMILDFAPSRRPAHAEDDALIARSRAAGAGAGTGLLRPRDRVRCAAEDRRRRVLTSRRCAKDALIAAVSAGHVIAFDGETFFSLN